MYDYIVSIAEKEIRLCKNIAKFLQNLPFQLAKFCFLDAKFEIFFCKKPRGNLTAGPLDNLLFRLKALKTVNESHPSLLE